MARPFSSAAAITSSSRIEPPGWMTAVAPACGRGEQSVGEGEEGVGGDDRAPGQRRLGAHRLGGVLRLQRRNARRVDAAHLARADTHRRAVLGVDDGVRLDVLGDLEGEQKIGELALGRRALGDDLESAGADDAVVARLHEKAARERAHHHAGRARIGSPPVVSRRKFFLAAKIGLGLRRRVGRDHDLGEDLGDLLGRVRVDGAVERDDAAEGADGIAARAPSDRRPSAVAPSATPHGLACLMMATAGAPGPSSATSSKAASVSLRLL